MGKGKEGGDGYFERAREVIANGTDGVGMAEQKMMGDSRFFCTGREAGGERERGGGGGGIGDGGDMKRESGVVGTRFTGIGKRARKGVLKAMGGVRKFSRHFLA